MKIQPKRYTVVPYTDAGPAPSYTIDNETKTAAAKALRALPKHFNFAVIYTSAREAPMYNPPVGVAIRGSVGWSMRFVR